MQIQFNPAIKFSSINSTNRLSFRNTNALVSDVFVKSPSFSAHKVPKKKDNSFKAFEKWAKNTDFLSNINYIEYKTIVLGDGFEGVTRDIPNTNRWVIKTYKRGWLANEKLDEPQIIKVKDYVPELNVGQEIACIKTPISDSKSRIFHIMKRQEGKTFGVSVNKFNIEHSKYFVNSHLDSLKELAELPQKSFDEFVSVVHYLNEKGIALDCYNPNNIMLDTKNKKINIVDTEKIAQGEKCNQLGSALYVLLDGIFHSRIENSRQKSESMELINKITEKYLKAMKNNNLLFPKDLGYLYISCDSGILDGYLPKDKNIDKAEYLNNIIENI